MRLSFISFLQKYDLITKLAHLYNLDVESSNLHKLIQQIFVEIDKAEASFKIYPYNERGLDLISNVYAKHVSHENRKLFGEFYTPIGVVDYILTRINFLKTDSLSNCTIIDPSCGAGSFLIRATERFIERFLRNNGKQKLSQLKVAELKYFINLIEKNIHGIDVNPLACFLCQINLYYSLLEPIELINEKDSSFIPYFEIKCQNALQNQNYGAYDYVVGNPPYVFIRDLTEIQKQEIETIGFQTAIGQYDLYQLFLELGIKLLKPQGKLGFIIPDSVLALSNRSSIRKFILNTAKILEIYHTGPKFKNPVVSNIILILQKEISETKRSQNETLVKIFNNDTIKEHEMSQSLFQKWNHSFLIHLNEQDISILMGLNNLYPNIADLMQNTPNKMLLSRGVELGKGGEIIYCENCQQYYPLPRKIDKCRGCKYPLDERFIEEIMVETPLETKKANYAKFISELTRYCINKTKYIELGKTGINYKDGQIYKNRILIRQLNQENLICASYDDELSYTSQSVYNLKILETPNPYFSHFYLLGLLNSQLLSYYFIKTFGTYKRLFPRILIEKIKKLPIKLPETDEEQLLARRLCKQVSEMLKICDNANRRELIQREIDDLVFNLYEISENHREYIRDFIKEL